MSAEKFVINRKVTVPLNKRSACTSDYPLHMWKTSSMPPPTTHYAGSSESVCNSPGTETGYTRTTPNSTTLIEANYESTFSDPQMYRENAYGVLSNDIEYSDTSSEDFRAC